jgi:eukaryotic-like serine/threonine-protein kinase
VGPAAVRGRRPAAAGRCDPGRSHHAAAWPARPGPRAPRGIDLEPPPQHDRRLDALWDPARQEAIERAFLATGLPYAPTAWASVRDHMDGFGQAWRTAQRDACEAEARGEGVGERMLCLHRRFESLRSLVELLEQADAAVVEHAVEAARALETIESCESDDGRPAPPADPATRKKLEELDALLARVRVEEQAGRREQALALANDAVRQADALGLRWSQAEASFELALAADDDGDGKPSRAAFEAAFSAGLAAGHEAVVSRAAMGIAGLVSRTGELEEADRWLELAAAAIARRGEQVGDLAQLEGARGRIDFHRGAFESALDHFRRSLELEATAGRSDHPSRGSTLLNIGMVLSRLGRYDEALASLDEALAHEQRHFGESHPHAVRVLAALCDVRNHTDQLDAALAACEQGIAFTRQTAKADDPRLVHLYTNYGTVLFRAGRYAQTEQVYLEALALAGRI